MQKEGGLFALPTLVDPIFLAINGARDRDKKIVGRFFVSSIRTSLFFYVSMHVAHACIVEDILGEYGDHFLWQKWCDFGGLHGLCIYGWDGTIIAPGPDFDVRSVKADQWHRLVERIDWRGNPYFTGHAMLEIRRWEPGKHFNLLCLKMMY